MKKLNKWENNIYVFYIFNKMIEYYFDYLNNSKLFAGCIMILMNLASRHLMIDLPEYIDNIFAQPIFRTLIVFSVSFVATRDIKISILISLLFILFFRYLLNPNSKSSLVRIQQHNITKNQYNNALHIIHQYKQQQRNY